MFFFVLIGCHHVVEPVSDNFVTTEVAPSGDKSYALRSDAELAEVRASCVALYEHVDVLYAEVLYEETCVAISQCQWEAGTPLLDCACALCLESFGVKESMRGCDKRAARSDITKSCEQ